MTKLVVFKSRFWANEIFCTFALAQRVIEGGHNIPEDVILNRYFAGIRNFFRLYKNIVDVWLLINNERNPRVLIAQGGIGCEEQIMNVELYNRFKDYV